MDRERKRSSPLLNWEKRPPVCGMISYVNELSSQGVRFIAAKSAAALQRLRVVLLCTDQNIFSVAGDGRSVKVQSSQSKCSDGFIS